MRDFGLKFVGAIAVLCASIVFAQNKTDVQNGDRVLVEKVHYINEAAMLRADGLGDDPVKYLERRTARIDGALDSMRKLGLDEPGITFENGQIVVNNTVRPELQQAGTLFRRFITFFEGRDTGPFIDELLERGFDSSEIWKLNRLCDPKYELNLLVNKAVQEALEEHSVGYLWYTTNYTPTESKAYRKISDMARTNLSDRLLGEFLEDLSPKSRRVFLSYLFEVWSGGFSCYGGAPENLSELLSELRPINPR